MLRIERIGSQQFFLDRVDGQYIGQRSGSNLGRTLRGQREFIFLMRRFQRLRGIRRRSLASGSESRFQPRRKQRCPAQAKKRQEIMCTRTFALEIKAKERKKRIKERKKNRKEKIIKEKNRN